MTPMTSSRTVVVAIAAVAALALSACGSDGSDAARDTDGDTGGDASPTADDLDGRAFESTDVTGYELVDGTTIALTFDDDRMSVNAGCNTLMGGYSIDDGSLIADELAMTMMACDEPLMAQDTWLNEFLSSAPQVGLDDETLTLTGEEATLTFSEIADAELEGTTWTVVGIIDGDSVSSVPEGAASFVITDGTIALSPGCNTGGGDVEVGDTTLTFGPLVTTMMACTDDALTELETAVLTVLDGEVEYQIDGNSLVITAPSGAGLQLSAD